MTRTTRAVLITVMATLLVGVPGGVWAGHTFNDVPSSNIFHGDIEWMADAGVTKGCNPPDNTEFCPEDNVTREQMAAFMRRLAENQVVHADTVDGQHAGAFAPTDHRHASLFGAVSNDGFTDNTFSTGFSDVAGMSTEVEIPQGHTGRIAAVFNGESQCYTGGQGQKCSVRILVDGAEIGPTGRWFHDVDDGTAFQSHSIQRLSGELGPGTHTVTAQFSVDHSDVYFELHNPSLTARVELVD